MNGTQIAHRYPARDGAVMGGDQKEDVQFVTEARLAAPFALQAIRFDQKQRDAMKRRKHPRGVAG
jgi:hypothetical protein